MPLAACSSCGHQAQAAEMKPELKFDWSETGGVVCRDADACYARWLAR